MDLLRRALSLRGILVPEVLLVEQAAVVRRHQSAAGFAEIRHQLSQRVIGVAVH